VGSEAVGAGSWASGIDVIGSQTTHCEFVERDTNNKYQQTPPCFQPLTPVLYLINTLEVNANKIPSLFYVCGMFNRKL
jgi:hypothetical protein